MTMQREALIRQLFNTLLAAPATRDEALRDAYRCRQALQQILEIVRAVPPSGRALALDGSPEAVAALVGHVLRCEAKR